LAFEIFFDNIPKNGKILTKEKGKKGKIFKLTLTRKAGRRGVKVLRHGNIYRPGKDW